MNKLSQHFCLSGVRLCLLLMLSGCAFAETTLKEDRMWMTVGEHRFAITLDDSETSRALAQLLPLTLDMSECGFHGHLATHSISIRPPIPR
jgi:hypothetical protein